MELILLVYMLNATENNNIVWLFNVSERRVYCDWAFNSGGNRYHILFGSLFTLAISASAIEVAEEVLVRHF